MFFNQPQNSPQSFFGGQQQSGGMNPQLQELARMMNNGGGPTPIQGSMPNPQMSQAGMPAQQMSMPGMETPQNPPNIPQNMPMQNLMQMMQMGGQGMQQMNPFASMLGNQGGATSPQGFFGDAFKMMNSQMSNQQVNGG